jgi:hypothetical protein
VYYVKNEEFAKQGCISSAVLSVLKHGHSRLKFVCELLQLYHMQAKHSSPARSNKRLRGFVDRSKSNLRATNGPGPGSS